ncbi:hypothetical protein MKW94_018320, partial [Papaver nudicaule]|nr:hypothetical protein [Papaver nudicaule]
NIVFSHSQTVVVCGNWQIDLCQPTGVIVLDEQEGFMAILVDSLAYCFLRCRLRWTNYLRLGIK